VAYEPFKRTKVRVDVPAIAVAPNGRLGLNSASTRVLKKAGVRALRVLWDGTTNGIALQAASKDSMDSYSVSFAEDYNSATISTKAFLWHIGWSATSRQVIPATWNAEKKMLEARLPSEFVGKREQQAAKRKTKTA
jgi:hypothetical protein